MRKLHKFHRRKFDLSSLEVEKTGGGGVAGIKSDYVFMSLR
jgi:hypothetical protein